MGSLSTSLYAQPTIRHLRIIFRDNIFGRSIRSILKNLVSRDGILQYGSILEATQVRNGKLYYNLLSRRSGKQAVSMSDHIQSKNCRGCMLGGKQGRTDGGPTLGRSRASSLLTAVMQSPPSTGHLAKTIDTGRTESLPALQHLPISTKGPSFDNCIGRWRYKITLVMHSLRIPDPMPGAATSYRRFPTPYHLLLHGGIRWLMSLTDRLEVICTGRSETEISQSKKPSSSIESLEAPSPVSASSSSSGNNAFLEECL
jgi:hypothetical protein